MSISTSPVFFMQAFCSYKRIVSFIVCHMVQPQQKAPAGCALMLGVCQGWGAAGAGCAWLGGNCCTSRPVAPKVQLGCFTSHRKQVFIQKMTLAFFGPFRSLLHLSIGSFFKVFLKNIISCLVCICAVLTAPKLLLVVGPLQTSVWGFHAPYHRMEIWKYKYGNCDSCVYAYIEGISMYLVARLGIYFDLFWWFPEYKAVGVAAVQSWCPGLGFVAHR